MLPLGCARLATIPAPTGSPEPDMTIGIVGVACFAACTAAFVPVTMTSGAVLTNSAARSERRSVCPPQKGLDRKIIIAVAERAKILSESLNVGLADKRRPSDKKGDATAFWRLRAGGKRPANGAAEEGDDVAPP